MVPGGVVSMPSGDDLVQCRHLVTGFRRWYEARILGCSVERWLEVRSAAALDAWLEERDEHREGELGFFVRFARGAGLDRVGRGHGAFLSFGCFDLPAGTAVRGPGGGEKLVPAGFLDGGAAQAFDQAEVAEHVAYSWYEDAPGGRHPFEGRTVPYATGEEGSKYSWAKAPRYRGRPAETGPLAELLIGGDPLFVDIVARHGASALVRQLARLTRPAHLLPAMGAWLVETAGDGDYYRSPGPIARGRGFGLAEAARGAIGHWVEVDAGRITRYQIITPTAWHASPRDTDGVRGPIEEALVGTPIADPANPVELGHVVRSFDPCLVCTVHAVRGGEVVARRRLGALP
jgi:hydrogenase large subunit